MLHGGANDWTEWRCNINALAEHYRIYALDLPGYGLSQSWKSSYTYAELVDFTRHFADALELEHMHLVGHSLGGRVCLDFAFNYPERVNSIVLVDSCGLAKMSALGMLVGTVWWIVRHLVPQVRTYPQVREESVSNHDRHYLSYLPSIHTPTLIVWGEKDIYFPVKHAYRAHSLLPNSWLEVFPDCGHAPQRGNPELFNRLVLDFFAESRAPATS